MEDVIPERELMCIRRFAEGRKDLVRELSNDEKCVWKTRDHESDKFALLWNGQWQKLSGVEMSGRVWRVNCFPHVILTLLCVISECFPISSKDVKNSALFCTNEIKLKWSDIGSGKSFGKWIVHYNWVISQKGLICGFVLLLKVSPVEKALRIRVWRSEILLICAKIFIQFHDFIFTVLAGNFCYNACKRSMYMTLYQYGMFCCEWTTTLEGKDKGSAIIQAVFVYI